MYRIGEAAQRAGVSERTLRYYEELGLVAPAEHSPGGNRRYGDAEVARVRHIRELQELMGLNLDEIRNVVCSEDKFDALRARWHASEEASERRRILEEALAVAGPLRERVDAKRIQLATFLDELDRKIARYHELLADLRAPEPAPAGRRR